MRLRLQDVPAVALAVTAFAVPAAHAQDPGRTQRFEQRDQNRDGMLSRDEYVATGGHPGNFRAMDRNNDGLLSREEFGAGAPGTGTPAAPAPATDPFRDLDHNGDGVLSQAEWNDTAFVRVDRNNDGVLSRDEYQSPLDPASAEGRFGDLDRDNNGWLTRTEFGQTRVVFDRADWNRDGRVNLDEYVNPRWSDNTRGEFDGLDRDRSGWLSRSEFGQNRVAFDRADRNNDGRVYYDEWSAPRADDSLGARFDVLDRNNDRVISRGEWRNETRLFDRLDQDNDGRVERDEYLNPPAVDDRESRFDVLDRNNDGIVSSGEWRNEPLSFNRVDLNRDGRVSFREYWDRGQADDDYTWNDRWTDADRNGDGVVTRAEWAGDAETFALLDTSRNGRLEAREINNPAALRDRFRSLDYNRDGWVSRQEWRGSQSSFDFFDRDRDRRLSDREYGSY